MNATGLQLFTQKKQHASNKLKLKNHIFNP